MSNIYDELDARAEFHEPQAQVFPLSCGCSLADIRRVAPGVGVCRHKRVLLAPLAARFAADADFVRRGRQMNDDKNQNFFGELMRQAEAADEEQAAMNKLAGELLRQAEEGNVSRAGNFVADYIGKMCDSPEALRSNSRKLCLFQILTSAACDVYGKIGDQESDDLHTFLNYADFHLVVIPNSRKFRATIVDAFKKSKFSHLVELAEAIKREETAFAIRRLRRKLGLTGKRAASAIQEMSEEEAQFYR